MLNFYFKPVLAGIAFAAVATAAPQDTAPKPPAFEVASIKPHEFTGPGGGCSGFQISGNRVSLTCLSTRNLIMRAYGLRDYQISGGPAWLSDLSDPAYDIAAEAAGDAKLTMEQVLRMLQSLLADRFQFKFHRETRELPVYALVSDKDGPKFKESDEGASGTASFTMGGLEGRMNATKQSMVTFANFLSREAGRPVLDKTGLTGVYDVALEWNRDEPQRLPGPDRPEGPSLFTAVREQLGLKLEPEKKSDGTTRHRQHCQTIPQLARVRFARSAPPPLSST